MEQTRIFTDEELRELVRPLSEKIAEAIDRGDTQQAKELARELEEAGPPLLYIFEEWVTVLLGYIQNRCGDEGVEEALRASAQSWFKPWHDQIARLSSREQLEAWAATMQAHTGRGLVRIEEDEEKFTLILDPCGSGLRMWRGGYYGPPKNLAQVSKAQPITFSREGFPIYCTHCAVIHQIMPIEWSGAPLPVMVPARTPEEACRILVYKDRQTTPEAYYQNVGKKK